MTINDIEEVLGNISASLKTEDSIGWTKISCNMKNRKAVSKLSKGQQITVIETCKGLTLNISINLNNCKVWE